MVGLIMQWYSVKTHEPPMETICLIFTENNYYYVGRLIDSSERDTWATDSECEGHGSLIHTVFNVTHFCIPDPVEIEHD